MNSLYYYNCEYNDKSDEDLKICDCYDDRSDDEDLKKAIEASLDDNEFNKILELSKNNNLELFTEELQLEAAIKLSLSIKQPLFQTPIGKIYDIDDVFKDTLFNTLINRGCLKDLYSFCITRYHYYEIIRKERRKINDLLLSLKQIHPSSINFKINSFENYRCFELDKFDNKIFTKQYYLVANSDKCGCTTKNTILYIKIPTNENILIGINKDETLKIFKCDRDRYYSYKNSNHELKEGTNYNIFAKILLDSCVYDIRCDEILKS